MLNESLYRPRPYALQRVTSIILFSKSISVFGYRFDKILDDTDLNRRPYIAGTLSVALQL